MSSMQPRTSDERQGAPRKAVSKRVRFEVLRRDNYTCRYCRSTDTPLTIDHVTPVVLGGTDDPSNLVAACRDCNSGKASSSPDEATVAQVSEDAVRWSVAMQAAAEKMRHDFRAEWDYADALDEEWSGWTYGYQKHLVPRPADWRNSANAWRTVGLPIDLLIDAARRALANDKIPPHNTWKYFCGIAWKRITQIQETAEASAKGADEDEEPGCNGEHSCDCEALAYEQGAFQERIRAFHRFSVFQYSKLTDVCDAEAIAWTEGR